jgi:hypothetical protein
VEYAFDPTSTAMKVGQVSCRKAIDQAHARSSQNASQFFHSYPIDADSIDGLLHRNQGPVVEHENSHWSFNSITRKIKIPLCVNNKSGVLEVIRRDM